MENYVNDSHFLTGFVFFFSYNCSPSLPFYFSSLPFNFFYLTTLHFHSQTLSFFSILTPSCASSPLMRSFLLASKGALERIHQPDWYSQENASSFALFCSTHYYIYPTLDSLYCRSQGLFSNLLHSSMKL